MSPIVLLHGIFGFGLLRFGPIRVAYFRRIDRALRKRGHAVLTPNTYLAAPVRLRAQRLKEFILPWLERFHEPAIIIAHSMGGLDARYMLSRLGMDEHVAALATIATPHHGSPLADAWMNNIVTRRILLPVLRLLGLDAGGALDLTTAAAKEFNAHVPDSPRVRYFSVTTDCPGSRMPLALRPGYWIIRHSAGANDGLVPASSAVWGEHLCTWPIHHLHAVNRRFPIDCLSPVGSIESWYVDLIEQVEAKLRQPCSCAPAGCPG